MKGEIRWAEGGNVRDEGKERKEGHRRVSFLGNAASRIPHSRSDVLEASLEPSWARVGPAWQRAEALRRLPPKFSRKLAPKTAPKTLRSFVQNGSKTASMTAPAHFLGSKSNVANENFFVKIFLEGASNSGFSSASTTFFLLFARTKVASTAAPPRLAIPENLHTSGDCSCRP